MLKEQPTMEESISKGTNSITVGEGNDIEGEAFFGKLSSFYIITRL
jgi:hypothetical protein